MPGRNEGARGGFGAIEAGQSVVDEQSPRPASALSVDHWPQHALLTEANDRRAARADQAFG
ncbi:hypothetical protein AB0J43_12780 [Nonomuraea fuscirosea]